MTQLYINTKCNCGRDGRYTHYDTETGNTAISCNKHIVCPPYEELEQANKDLVSDLSRLLKAAVDVTLHREGTDLYNRAEKVIEDIAERFGGKK